MNFRIIIFTFLLTCYIGQSQTKSKQSKITYSISLNTELMKKKLEKVSPKLKEKIQKRINSSNNLEFFLFFENNKSIYYENKKMNIENHNPYNLLRNISGKGKYYYDNNFNYNKKDAFGEIFIVKSKKKLWTLSNNETKKINNYTCYKATTKLITENSTGIHENTIIAWYTKDIPSNYGPKEYNGLPGIILQIYERSFIITATKIELNINTPINIEKPSKGKLITLEKFNKLSKELFNNRYN